MTNEKLVLFLQSMALITADEAREIAHAFRPKLLRKQAFLLQAGKVSDDYVFLHEGFLRAFAQDTSGNDITTGFYASGQVVFEVASFFQRTPSLESIQALTDCAGWALTHAELNALFHARPAFREFGRAVLVQGFAALKTRMLATITEPAAARYERLLRAAPEVAQHAPLKYIASYLGITDTSLSRLRKTLARK